MLFDDTPEHFDHALAVLRGERDAELDDGARKVLAFIRSQEGTHTRINRKGVFVRWAHWMKA